MYYKALIIIFFFLWLSFPAEAQLKVDHFLRKGVNEYYNEDYTQSIHTFNTLIRSRPDLSEPHLWRGRAKLALGDFRGAEYDFTRAIMLDAYNPDAYYFRGVVKSNLFDYYSALDDYKKSLERRPNNTNVFFSRGTTRLRMKDFQGAIKDFDTLLLLRPDIEQAYLNRSLAKAGLEDFEEAINDCNLAIKRNSFYTQAYIQRGLYHNELEQFDNAMNDFNQAIKLEKNNPLTYFYRAAANIKIGDTLAALNDFSQVLELDPFNDLTYYNRAMIFLQQENFEMAIADLQSVLDLNPNNIYTLYNLGLAHLRLEKHKQAIADFSKAIEVFPDFAAAYLNRSYSHQQLGDRDKAKEDYDIAIAITNAINSEEEFELINSKYAADTTYLQKIIEFEADFNANNVAAGKIQNRRVMVQLLPNFSYRFMPLNDWIRQERKPGNHFSKTGAMKTGIEGVALGVATEQYKLSDNLILRLSRRNDSITWYDPFNAENYFQKGVFNSMMMNYNEALTAFNRATELKPQFPEAYFNRAYNRFQLIEHRFSLEQSQPQITITQNALPQSTDDNRQNIPDFSDVIADYNMVIQLEPQNSFAYFNRGNIKNRMRDFEGAISDYSMAISLEPEFAEAFYNRALTLIYLNQNKEACYDLSKAGELGITEAYNVIKRYCSR
jgi:tetratricopeptide (TPR) repeat protein